LYFQNGFGLESVVWLPDRQKTKVGIVMWGTYIPDLPSDGGWAVHGDNNIVFAKPFGCGEVIDLLDRRGEIRKPEFNVPQLYRWLMIRHRARNSYPDFVYPEGFPGNIECWMRREIDAGRFGYASGQLIYQVPNDVNGAVFRVDLALDS